MIVNDLVKTMRQCRCALPPKMKYIVCEKIDALWSLMIDNFDEIELNCL